MSESPGNEQLGARGKSWRQLAVDVAGIAGLWGLWWSMMELPHPDYWLSSLVFLLFLLCLLAFLYDVLPRYKKMIMVFVSVVCVVGYSKSLWHRIYNPKFCYAIIFIPALNMEGPPYHLGLGVANGESIKYVSVLLYDFTNVSSGEDATKIISQSKHRYAPIVYSLAVNDTGIEVLCENNRYHVEMGTEEGSFAEELECQGNPESQRITISRMDETIPSERNILVKDWMPLKKNESKPSNDFDLPIGP